MTDHVLEWLDKLDDHWQRTKRSPPLDEWLKQSLTDPAFNADTDAANELISELLRADLDWRLRQNPLSTTELHCTSLLTIPQVIANPSLRLELLDDEFAFRCAALENATPNHFAELAANLINEPQKSLEEHFLNTVIERKKVEVMLFQPFSDIAGPALLSSPAIQCQLGRQLEIGRAHENEPLAPALIAGDPPRLIVAQAREVSISRNQILLKREQWSTVKVKNISAKVPITIGETKQIQPQRQAIISTPFVITIGKTRLRVQ